MKKIYYKLQIDKLLITKLNGSFTISSRTLKDSTATFLMAQMIEFNVALFSRVCKASSGRSHSSPRFPLL